MIESYSVALCVPVRGMLYETKGVWGLLADGFTGKVYVADALEDKETEYFLKKLLNRRLEYLPAKEHSLIEQLNLLWQTAKEDILIFTHNDVYLYGFWQSETVNAFYNKRVGFAAAFGVQGTLLNGGRLGAVSNMLEAEMHGVRLDHPIYISHGDGFYLAFRREALEKVGGFDARYIRFHGYDRDICLSLLDAGYLGVYVPISCHHRGGVTSCSSEYQEYVNKIRNVEAGGDKLDHDENMYVIFNEKWGSKLPVLVDAKTGGIVKSS